MASTTENTSSTAALAIHIGTNHTRFKRIKIAAGRRDSQITTPGPAGSAPPKTADVDAGRGSTNPATAGGVPPSTTRPAESADDWDQVVTTPTSPGRFTDLIRRSLADYSDGLTKVAVSVPGVVDEAAGLGLVCPNIPWLEQFRLGDLISRETPAEVRVIQEVRALALGHRATSKDRDFLLVDFGTGMGSAIILNGGLIRPAIPVSGEIGHNQSPDNDRRCGCGGIGCVETLVSRASLMGFLSDLKGTVTATFDDLAAHVAENGVEPWLAKRLDAVGRAIGAALNTVGLPKVVLTGSLMQLPSVIATAIADATRKHALAARYRELEVISTHRRRLEGLVEALQG